MRGVLVDDHQPVARLRHDVSFVHLRARGAERTLDQIGCRLEALDRASADGAPTSKAACAASAKPSAVAPRMFAPIGRKAHRPRRRAPPVIGAAPRLPERTEGGDGGAAAGGRGALALARQRLLQRAHDQPAHQRAVAEAHLGLGRMHVDVDLARLDA